MKKLFTALTIISLLMTACVSCSSNNNSSVSDSSVPTASPDTPDELPDIYMQTLENYASVCNSSGSDYITAALPESFITSMKNSDTYDTIISDMDAYVKQLTDVYEEECGNNVTVSLESVDSFSRLNWMQLDGVQLYFEALADNFDTPYSGHPASDGYEISFTLKANGSSGSYSEHFCYCAVLDRDGSCVIVELSGEQLTEYMDNSDSDIGDLYE